MLTKKIRSKQKRKHYCSLDLGSNSLLPESKWPVMCHTVCKTCLIAQRHPATYRHFRSYPKVIAERQRQLIEGGTFVIHPFSSFSLYWNTLMSLVNLTHMVISSLRLCFILPQGWKLNLRTVDHVLLTLHLVCLIDVAVKFNVGYLEGKGNVILDKPLIAWNYLRSWFLIDFVSSLPISYILIYYDSDMKYILIAHAVANLKAFRFIKDINHIVRFIKIFHVTYMCSNLVRLILFFLMSAHWCSCFIYISPVLHYYWTGNVVHRHSSILNTTDFISLPLSVRYRRGFFICLSAFMGTGYSLNRIFEEPFEVVIHAMLILYAALFMIYTIVILMKIYFTKYNSVIRYNELMNQLEEYMRHKQFPMQLKKRVADFYYYQYQGNYFREDYAFSTLSEQLRNEIMLHTRHKLVDKVTLFAELPASVVGSVLGCLQSEVYLPNDLVVRAGDIGDCMYFIANGTVAVYSLKGVEVCHLEDGACFGEVALLMKDSKRVATVVAVEITTVYRLNADDFREYIKPNQVLYERIEALASQRMHETVLLDEAFRRNKDQILASVNNGTDMHRLR